MVHARLSGFKDRAIATAGATAVILSLPLVSAVANAQSQLAALSYANQRQIAVVDPITGLLIHPLTGVVINLANVIYDPVLSQYVDRVTGAIIPTDGSIPGLPLLPLGGSQSANERPDSTSRTTDEAAQRFASPAAPATSLRQARAPGSQPSEIVPEGEGLVTSAQSGLPPPTTAANGDGSIFVLPSPAAVIASVVDLVLGSSDSPKDDETPASPPLPSDAAASSHSKALGPDDGSGGTALNRAEADVPADLAFGAVPGSRGSDSADVPQLSATRTLVSLGAETGPSLDPQIASPSALSTPPIAGDSAEFAQPLPATSRDPKVTSGLTHVVDGAPSWLLATAGGLLILIGGTGLSYQLRRRGLRV